MDRLAGEDWHMSLESYQHLFKFFVSIQSLFTPHYNRWNYVEGWGSHVSRHFITPGVTLCFYKDLLNHFLDKLIFICNRGCNELFYRLEVVPSAT